MIDKSVLIVEDDPDLADLLVWHFSRDGYTVRQTDDGEAALLLAEEQVPDVMILDWMIKNISGIEVCRRLRRSEITKLMPVIMLTARTEEEEKIRGLQTGADDYVTKPFSPKELLARVEALIRRTRPSVVSGQLAAAGIIMNTNTYQVTRDDVPINLGPTEFRLLRYFLERPNRVCSRAQIQDGVWSFDAEIDERTVDVHIRRLRKAMNIPGTSDVIRTVRSAGYALNG